MADDDSAAADARADVHGTVEALWTSPEDGAPMESHESIDCVEGGIRGDRYLRGTGHYSPFDVCEVTFVAAEALETIREETGIDLTDGRHRRNVVVRGPDLRDLLETTFRVGEATFRGTRPRPPCAHVERVAGEEGVARALGKKRGGICADVVEPGAVRVGDELELLEADPRTVGRSIADRLREAFGGE
ncbi:MOSC domain-containing protein [Halogeometricum rufum]|uniref:MOSC domain-containing protein n=1 Tax=Halogeometricum rufum TaxID=553469 RepID=A0A1I6H011_9EURY|nr:MOSC domain-containing protein [Halogeometricum rufum]SFR47785.1 MOSC domain-containing protein [Halogeometricum rufum]